MNKPGFTLPRLENDMEGRQNLIDQQISATKNALQFLTSTERMGGFGNSGYQTGDADGKSAITAVYFDQTTPPRGFDRTGFEPKRISTSVSTIFPTGITVTNSALEDGTGIDSFLIGPKDHLRSRYLSKKARLRTDGRNITNIPCAGNEELEELLRELSARISPAEIYRRMSGGRKTVKKEL